MLILSILLYVLTKCIHSSGFVPHFATRKAGAFVKGSANLLFHWLTVLPIIWIGDVWFWLRVFWGWLYRQVDTSQRSWHANSIQWNLYLFLDWPHVMSPRDQSFRLGKNCQNTWYFFSGKIEWLQRSQNWVKMSSFPRRKTRMFTSNGMRGKSISNFQMISRWEGKNICAICDRVEKNPHYFHRG